ncbi:phospholipase D-like domain-containing protein [Dysosmobacter sp.]|uniref:phospholipase D-like domain-containing protein n=1 Tax=Dysosmobacter sp. TaxID=2591382 RepID=UPI002A84CA97|nr:phospholipase D-like domain-containing protein [Dysosmobacter sp.]MDY3282460.1 phospholipase D-like domain-containing protein [Dysosmobacter sp.]
MGSEGTGIRLIEKGKRGIIHAVFSRLGLILLLLVLQLMVMVAVFRWFSAFLPHLFGGVVVLGVIMVVHLLNSGADPTAKITWLILITLAPVFGCLFYLYAHTDVGHRAVKQRLRELIGQTRDAIPQDRAVAERLRSESPETLALAAYIGRTGCFPVYDQTDVTYFPSGEAKFAAMLERLEQAKDFIFLEYFIVDEGVMWGRILEILARKAREGVDVRVMYDGTCEFTTLPHDYPQRLEKLGIRCKMYAPLLPFISTHYNYRDHRKILVIDGHTAFTGGVNLADEYINQKEKFGHWKDTAIMLRGKAVPSFTLMFLQMWSMEEKSPVFEPYLNAPCHPCPEAAGYVLPFGDCPLDSEKVGEMVYMDILNRARDYVHIMSPYLILDGELETALKFAAERGVDVKLILPGIPDKKAPYALAKNHYASLLRSGVKIYEYTPGFVHAKVFVSDGTKAVVGTINLDYRSLYHHFECAAYLCGTSCIPSIEEDFQATLAKCRAVTPETVRQEKWTLRLMGRLLKSVAPLM